MDKAKKKQIKKTVTWILLAALVAGLTAMPLLAKKEAGATGPVASVYSAEVEAGSVSTALHGGGTLRTEGVEDVTLPSGVKITEFLVKNGDSVTAGTPLAAVDKVSVMTAITSVTETMEYLQKEMRSAKDEKVDSIIAATAGGRIKKIFAQKGDSVQEVMLRDGALALLSLDGLMAVKIEKKLDLLTGETVTVTLADGTEVSGRVESNLDGIVVITVEDKGYALGEVVTVTKDDQKVGSGELYVHNAWTAAAYSGIIKTVSGTEESKVSAGTTLFTLTETDFHGKLEYMSALHREYEELMQELFRMYNSGTIDAPCDGTVSGVDADSAHLLAAETGNGQPWQAELLAVPARKQAVRVELLSNVVWEEGSDETKSSCDPKKGEDCPETDPLRHELSCLKACRSSRSCEATGEHYPDCLRYCTSADRPEQCGATRYHHEDCIRSCTNSSEEGSCRSKKHNLSCIQSCISSNGTRDCLTVGVHKASCIEACSHADTMDKCRASLHHYSDCVHCCITSESGAVQCSAVKHNGNCFFADMTYKAKVAIVTGVGSSELVVRWDASGQEYDVEKTASGWTFAASPDFNVDLLVASGPRVSVSNPSAYKVGDVIFVITGYKGGRPEWTGISVFMRVSGNADLDLNLNLEGLLGSLTDSLTGMLSSQIDISALMGQLAGMGNFAFYAPPPVEEDKLFDLEGDTLLTVSPQDMASLTIQLDQQDIAKVSVGQKALVKVEALGEAQFEAVVTEASGRGTNRGGSSKFAVKLELPKMSDMLDGMSATVSLLVEEKREVPVIPVAALSEQGAWTVVYTALDEKTGVPTKPVPVTVGLSDGIFAEILEGLQIGDTYYYSYYDTLEVDTGVEDRFTLS